MKKYLFLLIVFFVIMFGVSQIPNIMNGFAKNCTTVSVLNNTVATESVFCKGIVEEVDGEYIVIVKITEDDISKVSSGQKVKITCKALGDNYIFGKVKEISDFAYQENYGGNNITVIDAIIEFSKKYENLKSGYSVTAEIVYTEINNANILPFEGVAQNSNGDYYIYTIKDGWAIKKYIDVIFEDKNGIVISNDYDFKTVCEAPEKLSGDFVRVKNDRYD